MPLSERYRHQVALLIETLPFVAVLAAVSAVNEPTANLADAPARPHPARPCLAADARSPTACAGPWTAS